MLRLFFFLFNDTATTEIYTLSLHDALPISRKAQESIGSFRRRSLCRGGWRSCKSSSDGRERRAPRSCPGAPGAGCPSRSEEHTSELQSPPQIRLRLLPGKTKYNIATDSNNN